MNRRIAMRKRSRGGPNVVRGLRDDSAHDCVRPRFRRAQSLTDRFLAERHPLDAYDLDVGDADETEYRAQVGLLEIERLHRALGINPAAREDEHSLLSGHQALRALLGISQRTPGPDDVIDPRLERRREAEIVR